jgi:ketosteroid isomerase-like protein
MNRHAPDLGPVADEVAIRALVHRYADAASRRDPAGVADTFTADGEWTAEGLGLHRGRPAVAAFFTTMLEGWNAFLQGLLSGCVDLDADAPDRATGRWFVQEIGQREDGSNLRVAGVYHDEYLRDAGVWRISRRRYDPLLLEVDGAVTALPFPTDLASGPAETRGPGR